jgi:hypothetical protein
MRNHIEKDGSKEDLLISSNLYHLSCGLLGKATYHWLISEEGEICKFILLSSRLRLVKNILGGERISGGYDCQHIWDFIFSLAAHDKVAIDYYLSSYKPPFKKAHKFTKSVSNYTYSLLLDDDERGKFSASTKFEKAVKTALDSIYSNDSVGIENSIIEVANCYGRTDFAQHYHEKFICYFVMGLISIANRVCNFKVPGEFVAKGFDLDLYKSLEHNEKEYLGDDLIDVSKCSLLWSAINNPLKTDIVSICSELRNNFDVVNTHELRT